MEEIAVEAGVSKPTLYATFKNKDAALGGAIRYAKSKMLHSVFDDWNDAELPGQLDIFMERIVLAGYDILHNSPDADALENSIGGFSQDAIDETRDAMVDALETLFQGSARLMTIGSDANSFARFVVDTSMNAKRLARSRGDLELHLQTLKLVVLEVLAHKDRS